MGWWVVGRARGRRLDQRLGLQRGEIRDGARDMGVRKRSQGVGKRGRKINSAGRCDLTATKKIPRVGSIHASIAWLAHGENLPGAGPVQPSPASPPKPGCWLLAAGSPSQAVAWAGTARYPTCALGPLMHAMQCSWAGEPRSWSHACLPGLPRCLGYYSRKVAPTSLTSGYLVSRADTCQASPGIMVP